MNMVKIMELLTKIDDNKTEMELIGNRVNSTITSTDEMQRLVDSAKTPEDAAELVTKLIDEMDALSKAKKRIDELYKSNTSYLNEIYKNI